MFLAIGCSSLATGGGGVHRGSDGEGVGNSWVGGNSPVVGGRGNWGGEQWGCHQPLRTALHNISKVSKTVRAETELKGSIRTINALWALPVYPIFEDEKSKASDEKSVKRKIA